MKEDINSVESMPIKARGVKSPVEIHTLTFLTTGQVLAFDKEGVQIECIQQMFQEGNQDRKALRDIAVRAEKLIVAKWPNWAHELSLDEFMRLTNIREV